MKAARALCLAAGLFLFGASAVLAQQSPDAQREALKRLQWQRGPTVGDVASKATIKVTDGFVFLDAANSSRFLELMGNPPRPGHYVFAPESLDWFVVYNFRDSGYVKDDEKIDADELLKILKDSDAPANKERKRLGMSELHTDGWQVTPHYDAATKRLEWGVRLRDADGTQIVNYTSRILGRSGYVNAVLVSEPKQLAQDVELFKDSLKGFEYVRGQSYAEFKSGDKVAEYGLTALIVGGAAAAAAKGGLFKSLGKFLWLIGIGAIAAIGALWKRLTGRKDE